MRCWRCWQVRQDTILVLINHPQSQDADVVQLCKACREIAKQNGYSVVIVMPTNLQGQHIFSRQAASATKV